MHPQTALIVWSLLGYFALQIALNLIRARLRPHGKALIRLGLVFSYLNHLYLLAVGTYAVFHFELIPLTQRPSPLGVVLAIPGALVVFALSVVLRQTGSRLFGRPNYLNPQEAVFFLTGERFWWSLGAINAVILRPLAEEAYLRGAVFLGILSLFPLGDPGGLLLALVATGTVQNLFYPMPNLSFDNTLRALASALYVVAFGRQLIPAIVLSAGLGILWAGFHTRLGLRAFSRNR